MKIVFFLFSFFITLDSYSYNVTRDFDAGIYWDRLPLSIRAGGSGKEKEVLESLVKESIEVWEEAVGAKIWQYDEKSKNIVRWADDFAAETAHDASFTLAVTIRNWDGSHFDKVSIILNRDSQQLAIPSILRTVIIHEMGHTVGLDHDDSFPGAVMNSSIQIDADTLAQDDENGIRAVYDETIHRQETNHVAAGFGVSSDSSKAISCGTVYMDTPGGPGGMMGMIFSLLLGMIAVWLPRKAFRLRI